MSLYFNKRAKPVLKWQLALLLVFATKWIKRLKIRKGAAAEASSWWFFVHNWYNIVKKALSAFIKGDYHFQPMITYTFDKQKIIVWDYCDRLIVKLIYKIIKPLFKYIIYPSCFHLQGASGVKSAINSIKKALENKNFKYFIRADVKSYYASINRGILAEQVKQKFDDPRLLKYLENIIKIPIIEDAIIFNPDAGIPRRSSLSPFFGALYLSPLDQAFDNIEGVCYFRFMDDIVILAETKRQYLRAKRRLQNILSMLKLSLSRRKTKMGKLEFGFHFLGVNFAVSQNQQDKNHAIVSIHDRSCYRALDKINRTGEGTVDPVKAQCYLSRWATWWFRTGTPYFGYFDCLRRWMHIALSRGYFREAKFASGLMIS